MTLSGASPDIGASSKAERSCLLMDFPFNGAAPGSYLRMVKYLRAFVMFLLLIAIRYNCGPITSHVPGESSGR